MRYHVIRGTLDTQGVNEPYAEPFQVRRKAPEGRRSEVSKTSIPKISIPAKRVSFARFDLQIIVHNEVRGRSGRAPTRAESLLSTYEIIL